MTRKTTAALLAALCAALAACDTAPKSAVTKCELGQAIPGAAKTDILFVVDDSGSMADNQQNLADNFDAFIQVLASSPVKNEFQIGITTTSASNFNRGTDGLDTTTFFPRDEAGSPCPNANQLYPAGKLIALDPGSGGAINYDLTRILTANTPTLVEDFRNDVMVGTCGSGKEQGLRTMKLALSDRIADGSNAGFLRPDARLAIIIVSDEDDYGELQNPGQVTDNGTSHADTTKASTGIYAPVQSYVDFLHGTLAGQGRDVTVAVIAGVDPTTKQPAYGAGSGCPSAYDKADRYAQFVSAFGSKGRIDSICNPSFRDTLRDIAGLLDPGQAMPLDEAPADWRMLSVSVVSASGTRTSCLVGLDGAGGTPDVVYTPPIGATRASLTFVSDACKLRQGDRVELKVLCAG
jgi:hypothetical protein